MIGGGLVCVSIAFGNYVAFIPLLILWIIASFGQTLAESPSHSYDSLTYINSLPCW